MRGLRGSQRVTLAAGSLVLLAALSACGSDDDIVGVWEPDDGTGAKTINGDGSCSGMFYNSGRPLDIGGPMTCSLSAEESGGLHTLVVRQEPNQQELGIEFVDADTVEVYEGTTRLFTMKRR